MRPPWRRISAIVSWSVMPRGIFSSMKRPITSPWSAVFTSSATITLIPLARSRLECAGDLVVVGDRDRAKAHLFRGVKQRVHGRGAIGRVVGVHVQVHVDEVLLAELPADLNA